MTDGSDPLFDDQNPDPKKDLADLRQRMEAVNDKLAGRNSTDISLEDIAHYVRVVNYNFAALTGVMNRLLVSGGELALNQQIILEKLDMLEKQLKEFFDANSFLDDALPEDSDGSSSKEI